VALISSAPSDVPTDWFLTNEMMAQARATVNARLGGRRLLTHAIFTPGQPGWMEALERALVDLKPDSMKGYTIGDNSNKDQSRHPWRLDDEQLLYPAYEKMAKAGVINVGLFPPSLDQRYPSLRAHCDVRDVGKAAKDWPQLNFIIYHGAYRFAGGGNPADALAQFEQTGRVDWVTDLAEIPGKHGVTNVYADLGQLFALTACWCAAGAPTTSSGGPTRCGPARRNGRSKGCAGSRSRRTCRRSTASRRSAPRTSAGGSAAATAATATSSSEAEPARPAARGQRPGAGPAQTQT
jgi:hypothetical protein